ncbi:hypothetical protein RHMOL_Rhmol05G0133300 [Rhododendron molle]|uniref:Uncharacterized protein n=1 Tax=Rhododendron molle TaxID=49168 RepID=A0ACC0NQZ0_RHOML|nr:hypothetical protein RHMOL_Rhmol05G0133300 [Rhododendron molle]
MDELSATEPLVSSQGNGKNKAIFASSMKIVLKYTIWVIFISWATFIFLYPSEFVDAWFEKYLELTDGICFGIQDITHLHRFEKGEKEITRIFKMRYTLGYVIQQRSLTFLGDMDEVQKVFNKFETSGNGKISVSELHSVFKALGVDASASSANLTDAVTEIDKDGDGAIDLEEFADLQCRGGGGESNNGKAIGDAFKLTKCD